MISIRPTLDGGKYGRIELDSDAPVLLFDHLGGFNLKLENEVLEQLNDCTINSREVYCEYVFSEKIKSKYPRLNIQFDERVWQNGNNISSLAIPQRPKIDLQNFLCTFNSGPHISRKLLTATLIKRGWLDPCYSSKRFPVQAHEVIGHLYDYTGSRARWLSKFFIPTHHDVESELYNRSFYVGSETNLDHGNNLFGLQNSITQSFVHLVSETMATSYYPFVTEKFLYSVVNQGLFVAYAQPGWHRHVEINFGFRRYIKIFDYSFDKVENPVDRLLTLTSMLEKFRVLSRFDWHDLWTIEKETIMYNHDHWASGQYLNHIKNKLSLPEQSATTWAVNNI